MFPQECELRDLSILDQTLKLLSIVFLFRLTCIGALYNSLFFFVQTIADVIRTCLGPKAMLKVSLNVFCYEARLQQAKMIVNTGLIVGAVVIVIVPTS